MKFNVTAAGHAAEVTINPDGKGGFTGVITHTEFGDGQIHGGIQSGDRLTGKVVLSGHTATFEATITGASINGRISLNWLLSASFAGTLAA